MSIEVASPREPAKLAPKSRASAQPLLLLVPIMDSARRERLVIQLGFLEDPDKRAA